MYKNFLQLNNKKNKKNKRKCYAYKTMLEKEMQIANKHTERISRTCLKIFI